jgi:hypothetical protein
MSKLADRLMTSRILIEPFSESRNDLAPIVTPFAFRAMPVVFRRSSPLALILMISSTFTSSDTASRRTMPLFASLAAA